ncbi:Sarcosine dehydrogenase [Rubellimicrobium mesophilum DSM 19309]|uniref:Sarcosine dehydrogenase n=1 Tax=Rubellimicrobium mesophilum DSM 19309 TaxID=442562 RepID=A0A017HPL5_9RHOB|nr:FAD-dependent oxidoreductase [Rubellimicrobium mesophilum]EYD76068.1 Sarcosine dehydrogenase [Rubellimicrobium mesophilum DSM 19309]
MIPTHAQVVVIGGGIVGCSTAYHLARDHGAEVVLLEQGKLTSGSTWHAAGLVGQLRSSAGVTRLLKHSVELYKRLDEETGLATGWKMTGCLRLATNPDRWTEYRRLATTARSFGMEMELIPPREVKEMWPLLEVDDLVGASWLPTDGQANPADIAASLAKGARMAGAKIVEGIRVTGFDMDEGRIHTVQTTLGPIHCEKVVNCAGMWARDVGAMAGAVVPLQPVRHQYIVTEAIPDLAPNAPTLRDPDRRTYFKEEVGGLVMGGYEPDPQPLGTGEVPFQEFHLYDDDWDHFAPHMEQAIERIPALAETGVKRMINGAESFTPDGNFILGRPPHLKNFYVGAGFNAFGIASGGGAGWALASWVMEDEAPMDLWPVDIRRFGSIHADRDWVLQRTCEAYGKHYTIAWPHEEYESGRPRLTSPLYQRLLGAGAVMGSKLGWERANWFADEPGAEDEPSMNRPAWADAVAREHRHTRTHASVFDQTSFAKFELSGPGAAEALDALCAGDVLKAPGRLTYTQLLNSRGGIEADLTVARLGPEHFYIVTGTGFRTHDGAWIDDHLPSGLRLRDVTEEWGVLALMGPRARDILRAVTEANVENDAFPFAHWREVAIAGQPVRALRITYVGELGWELHVPLHGLAAVYDALMEADPDLRPAGYRAIESLRLEKGYRAWSSDITPNDTPLEAGLGWATKLRTPRHFLGREALERQARGPLTKRLLGFRLADLDAVLLGRETILRDGEPAGYLTSGGFGPTVGAPIGYGYVRDPGGLTDEALLGSSYAVVVAGETVPARPSLRPFHDPENAATRI